MHCRHCGTENAENVWNCQACGAPLANPYEASAAAPGLALPTGQIYNWLAPSIVATVLGSFCSCLSLIVIPCGIVAIVYAAQVNGMLRSGDIAGAVRTAGLARIWCLVTFGVASVGFILFVLFMGSGFIMDMMNQP